MESSTVMHGRENRQIKVDSLKSASNNLQFTSNSSALKKEVEKPASNQITKSVIQWMANFVKNILQIIINVVVDVLNVILMAIIKFLIS